jgi:diacylglycerol kinase family enzyme
MHRNRVGHITHLTYIWPICRTFWEYRFNHIRVEVDGEVLCDEPGLVFVGNISRYAIGLRILPHADCSDGLLDVCIYKCRNRFELAWFSLLTILQKSHLSRRVLRCRCREVKISSKDPHMRVEVDGDPGPPLPMHIKVVPAAAMVFAPRPSRGEKYRKPIKLYHLRNWWRR